MPRILPMVALLACLTLPAAAQRSVPENAGDHFKDTSMLKPPTGSRVAIYEFEDLECPSCAHAYPIVHAAAAHYNIPILRHDYALTEIHPWALDAAVTARYLQDRVSPTLAETFRRDVFANQNLIGGRDDLARFTQRWFQAHAQALPFVIDSTGACKKEVEADHALGDRLGRLRTPCIFVVTSRQWVQVLDLDQLDRTIDTAFAETGVPAVAKRRRLN